MENELFPQQEEHIPEQPTAKPSLVQQLLQKKTVLLGGGLLMLVAMSTYIIIAPSDDRRIAIATQLPTPTLTPLPPSLTAVPTHTPAPPAATPTITPTPTPTIPPGTAWKTYANTQYGYRIKYSPDWVVKDLGELEPKIPSYINVHPKSASESSRFITIGVTTRTYEEQLALGASSSAITVAGIKSTKQFFQDSDGNTSTVVIIPRTNDLIVLRAKTAHLTMFNFMLSTLYVAK